MTAAQHGADFDGELCTAIAARTELPVRELLGFEAAAVRTAPLHTMLAPTLRFCEKQDKRLRRGIGAGRRRGSYLQ